MRDEKHQDGTGMNRRDFVVQTACAGTAAGLMATVVHSALAPARATAASAPAAEPVAFVWMGQILVDPTGQQKPYIPAGGRAPITI